MHRLPQIERLDPGLDAHRKDLGERHPQHRAGAIVHGLAIVPGADRTDIGGLMGSGAGNVAAPFGSVV